MTNQHIRQIPIQFLIILAWLSQGFAEEKDKKEILKPRLVVQTPEALIHALPYPDTPFHFSKMGNTHPAGTGILVTHTSILTGKVKTLVSSGRVKTVAPGTSGVPHSTRIVGIANDIERLYVLVWFSGTHSDGRVLLYSFWLYDGLMLNKLARVFGVEVISGSLEWKKTAFKPVETVGAGPLKVTEGGVECFGTKLTFEGMKLVWTTRTPTNPPVKKSE